MCSPSTYIIDRNPGKFGGQQADFVARSRAAIAMGLRKISETVKDEKNLTDLFFTLLNDFEALRGEIAHAHGTKDADKFGRKRAEDGVSDHYFTYLDQEYGDYGRKLLLLLQGHLRGMKIERKSPGREIKKIEDPTTGSTFEIEVLDYDDLVRHHWHAPIASEHLPEGFPIDLLEKKAQSQTLKPAERRKLRGAFRQFKESAPELYKRFKMNTLILQIQHDFPSPKVTQLPGGGHHIDGEEGNLKSFYVLGTARLMVGEKRFATTQYLTWLYRDFSMHPADRMLRDSTIMVIHQDVFLMQETLQEIARIFAKAVLWDRQDLNDLKRQVGLFRAYFAHNMPCERGSAAMGDWFEALLYAMHDYEVEHEHKKMVDLETLTTPLLSVFLKNYEAMTILKPRA